MLVQAGRWACLCLCTRGGTSLPYGLLRFKDAMWPESRLCGVTTSPWIWPNGWILGPPPSLGLACLQARPPPTQECPVSPSCLPWNISMPNGLDWCRDRAAQALPGQLCRQHQSQSISINLGVPFRTPPMSGLRVKRWRSRGVSALCQTWDCTLRYEDRIGMAYFPLQTRNAFLPFWMMRKA